ncbi:MAG TPA: PAS domain S-box protein [Cyclobacteriaceae bacterium]|nr:PAS domain S-box protein [Cyclobacteriaceae bacterium]
MKKRDLLPDEELFDAIIDISSEAIWVRDFRKNTAYWLASETNRVKYEFPSTEIEGDFWERHIHPDDRETAVRVYQDSFNNPSVKAFVHHYRFIGSNAVEYFIEDRIRFIRDRKGTVLRVAGVWRDLTDEQKKQKQLQEAINRLKNDRQRFKQISEVTNVMTWEVNFHNGNVHGFSNKKALDDFKLAGRKYKLSDWESAIYEEDRERVVQNFRDIVNSDRVEYFDTYRVVKADGSLAYVIDQGKIVRDKKGQAVRALGGRIDLTKERERELILEKALEDQRELNRELAIREQELTSTEEELRQMNEQLKINLNQLEEREFILNHSQQLAKIGSWEYEIHSKKMTWSAEMYDIYGVDNSFDVSNLNEVLRLHDEASSRVVADTFHNMVLHYDLPFDITAQIKTPLGYKKWVRMTAHPMVEGDSLQRILGITYDITYFKEAEERLKTSEEKFAKAFRHNPDLMTIHRENDLTILDVNDKVLAVMGYRREEVIGRSARDLKLFVNPIDQDSYYKKYYRDGHSHIETLWRRKDGKIIHVAITSTRMELEGKLYSLNVINDISARKIAEELFVKAFDMSPDLMLIFREEDRALVEVNNQLELMSGYKRNEVIGKSANEFNLWASIDERNQFLEQYVTHGFANAEATLLKKHDITFYGTIAAQRIQLSNEDHMLVVVRNISERKSAEEKIRQSEANLNATINNTILLVWSVDRNFRLITFNRPFSEFIQARFGRDVSIGARILPDSPIKDDEINVREIWIQRYMRALGGETFKVTDENEKVYEFSLSPIIEGSYIIGVSIFGEDVTERKLSETRLAEANKKIGELKLTALRSVMNPHFIFNALNSIQYFIAQNDRKNAISYLSTFSKLIRGVLNNSVNNKIRLSEELELLQYYVNIELVRFDNKFDFVLTIDDHLDADSIEIPSLLIQPYVENAILHGLYNKPGRGILKISVTREGESRILFEIEDDGIGREAAMELKKKNFPAHKSMGIGLTEDRLRLINAQDSVSFETIDLYDGAEAVGTLMKIWVKI